MNNDDAMLLNYMYQKGFTEEDMYDDILIKKVQCSKEYLLYRVKLAVRNVFQKLSQAIKVLWEKIKPLAIALDKHSKDIKAVKTTIPKIKFNKIDIPGHQVMDRAPRIQVRKIIR